MSRKLITPVSAPRPSAGTRKSVAGGAMAQAGREMPLTRRSVMIRISPMIVTKIRRVPSLGSIGDAWVRMCSMPAAHRSV
jgi:hypothetical protein